jgi:hypothetical protein
VIVHPTLVLKERPMDKQQPTPWWRTKSGIVLLCFLAIGAFFLITEHAAHFFGVLPFLLLAACPLMHLFMHHGHGGHDHNFAPSSEISNVERTTGGIS